jgi:hypothetical protein
MVVMREPPEARAQKVAKAVTQLCFTTMVVEAEGVQVEAEAAQTPPLVFFNRLAAVAQGFVTPEIRLLPVHPVAPVRKATPEGGKEDKDRPATATQIAAHLVQ